MTECDRNKFRDFLIEEVREIERHKWIESEKAGYDLGAAAITDWLNLHAKKYREQHGKNHCT